MSDQLAEGFKNHSKWGLVNSAMYVSRRIFTTKFSSLHIIPVSIGKGFHNICNIFTELIFDRGFSAKYVLYC